MPYACCMASAVADDSTRGVLLAPLFTKATRWSSQDLADQLGTSQSTVARVWRAAFQEPDDRLTDVLNGNALDLIAVGIDADTCYIAFARTKQPPSQVDMTMRNPRRLPLQTLLAADLRRTALPASTARRESTAADRIAATGRDPKELLVLVREPIPDFQLYVQHVVDDEARWQALLPTLLRTCVATPTAVLLQLQLQLVNWATTKRARFEWVQQTPTTALPVLSSRDAQAPSLGQAIADEAFRVILQRIASGSLAAGDRITESSLQRALHTSRNQVRDALRSLASAGLVDPAMNRGALVPMLKAHDVIDTYAARRALGTVLIERVVTAKRRDLQRAETALSQMLRLAELNDARATGDADLRFQDELVAAAPMRQLPAMFRALSSQVLLFTTILGVKYVYSIPEMCADNVRIMKAVQQRDAAAAVAAWHRKIDAATTFMAANL